MEKTFKVGEKVLYKTLLCGLIKARVVDIETDALGRTCLTLKVTARTNKIFYCGYTFKATPLHTYHR